MNGGSALRRCARWLLPALLGVGLFALFLRRGGDAAAILAALRRAAARPALLVAGIAAFGGSLACGLVRWFTLLRALRLPVPFRDALRLYATGHCFNVLGPGATGGYLAKAAWIAMRAPGRRAEAIASIAAERLIGISTTLAYLAAMTWLRADFFAAYPPLGHALPLFALGALLALFFLAIAPVDAIAARIHLPDGGAAAKVRDLSLRVWRTMRLCLTHPRATLAAVLFSLGNIASTILCWSLLARALGLSTRLRDLAVATPLADTAAALPLTPGGAGLRENMLQFLLDSLGVPRAGSTALGLLMFATILCWALLCAVLALRGSKEKI